MPLNNFWSPPGPYSQIFFFCPGGSLSPLPAMEVCEEELEFARLLSPGEEGPRLQPGNLLRLKFTRRSLQPARLSLRPGHSAGQQHLAARPKPNQRRTLNKLPTELRRRNFAYQVPTEHTNWCQTCKNLQATCMHIFQLSSPILHRWWLGSTKPDSSFYLSKNLMCQDNYVVALLIHGRRACMSDNNRI